MAVELSEKLRHSISAGGLAWLTISGEDAADLVTTAPLPSSQVTRAKIEVVLIAIGALFAPAAHFIKADGGEGADNGKAGSQRKQERQQIAAQRDTREHQPDQGISGAKENHIAPIGLKIGEALA